MEAVAEQLAASGVGAGEFGSALADALAECASLAVAFKTVAAYRTGLGLRATAPSRREVGRAADRWLARCDEEGRHRLDDPTLVAHAVWSCLPFEVPLQVHTGYGDPDLTLHETDPSLLTPLLRALPADAAPVVLLHCYPYHRQAAYLANVFPHVVMDVSLAVNHLGPRAAAVFAETLELAPFDSLLYASDGFALPSCTTSAQCCSATGSPGCWTTGWRRTPSPPQTRAGSPGWSPGITPVASTGSQSAEGAKLEELADILAGLGGRRGPCRGRRPERQGRQDPDEFRNHAQIVAALEVAQPYVVLRTLTAAPFTRAGRGAVDRTTLRDPMRGAAMLFKTRACDPDVQRCVISPPMGAGMTEQPRNV